MKPPVQSTEEEIEALDRLCNRLSGFGADVSLEWLDGCLAALIVGPRAVMPSEWLPMALGDTWSRTFADPQDVDQALNALMRRWNVLVSQLDPEALFEDPDRLRLMPLIETFDLAQREELLAKGRISAEEAKDWPPEGEVWAAAFLEVVDRLVDDWQVAPGSGDAAELEAGLRCIEALTERDESTLAADLAIRYPGRHLSRDELIDEACFAVQDLRCFWLEQRTRPAPRHVEKAPGRNDPCPCGSGKKFKKCHGASGARH